MTTIISGLMAAILGLTLTVGAFAGNCCDGSQCCNGTTCCQGHHAK
jgi:hypothetical protein